MDAKIREFFDAVGNFFAGGDSIPWCERDVIAGCEKEVEESDSSESKNESLMRLSWALLHSRHTEDVNRGIAMLEDGPLQTREKLYLLAVGFYRNGDYSRSRQLLEQCLELAPDWKQAQTLKKVVENQVNKGITAIAEGPLVWGIAVGNKGTVASQKFDLKYKPTTNLQLFQLYVSCVTINGFSAELLVLSQMKVPSMDLTEQNREKVHLASTCMDLWMPSFSVATISTQYLVNAFWKYL